MALATTAPTVGALFAGAKGSGKSVALASAHLAEYSDSLANWVIKGRDGVALQFLTDQTDKLLNLELPQAGVGLQPQTYTFDVQGRIPPIWVRERFRRIHGEPGAWGHSLKKVGRSFGSALNLVLNMRDYPGETFLEVAPDDPDEAKTWKSFAATTTGIVYLVDITLKNPLDNFRYLDHIASLLLTLGTTNKGPEGKLSIYLYVALAKTDAPEVLEPLRHMEHMVHIQSGRPVISDPRRAIKQLAEDYYFKQMLSVIENRFMAERVTYGAMSSIGFYEHTSGQVDLQDYRNILEARDGPCLRQPPTPINVLEPLGWIYNMSRKTRLGSKTN